MGQDFTKIIVPSRTTNHRANHPPPPYKEADSYPSPPFGSGAARRVSLESANNTPTHSHVRSSRIEHRNVLTHCTSLAAAYTFTFFTNYLYITPFHVNQKHRFHTLHTHHNIQQHHAPHTQSINTKFTQTHICIVTSNHLHITTKHLNTPTITSQCHATWHDARPSYILIACQTAPPSHLICARKRGSPVHLL